VGTVDCSKVGKLIFNLRKEKNMTQRELADAMNLSDRTISKWERGIGCPDVSLLHELSDILGVNIEKILSGDLNPNDSDGGNMKRVKFYVCPNCANVLFGTGEAEISCCGRKLSALNVKTENEDHLMLVEEIENDYYVTINHEMSKSHYISFVAYVAYDRVLLIKLYPEQAAELRFPKMHGKKLYAYCNQHGLWENI
jgi:DNA-binding XRE family transcriptional regulator/desulfoferrodoxin (superoxide reductase-like protein)